MDPTICRDHLERLLAEECDGLARLQSLLEREHELLQANAIDELEQVGETRQACVSELVRIEDERQSVCRMHNVPADRSGLERLMRWCDPAGVLQARWAECAERATRCRDANHRNGAFVTARLKRVEGLLGAITGRAQAPQLYQKQGTMAAPSANGRVCVRA